MPPQFPTKPASAAAIAGVKRPGFVPAAASASPPPKKLARPASAPCLPALSSPSAAAAAAAPRKAAPRALHPPVPHSSAAARPAGAGGARKAGPRPEPEAAPCRAAESVHPTRRLACGTAVYVRTRYLLLTRDRCCLLIWLPARVVSSSDAYHCTVKYAAYLHAIFAGKIVRVPAADVREAPSHHRASFAAAPKSKADHAKSRPQAP